MKPIANMWLRKRAAAANSAEKTQDASPASAEGIAVPSPQEPASDEKWDEIVLTLGDFLPKIDARFLKDAKADPKREVRFKISELAEMVAGRKTKISLDRIGQACPDIFCDKDEDFRKQEIYFPWRKLADVMERITPPATEDGKNPDALALTAESNPQVPKATRPIAAFGGNQAAPKPGPLSQAAAKMQFNQPELLKRQRDLAVQQRDQALTRLKDAEERMRKQLTVLIAERDLAISEKEDALAFIALFSNIGSEPSAN